ncbi:MAG: CCA tRNA nucleotidyltransferase [Candidatus Micrarchaeota archaeon]|nr:CCA tRNA nucleotidyltransferase [Candidatus Micrarchaeota archaeon]
MYDGKYTLSKPLGKKFKSLLREVLQNSKPTEMESQEVRTAINEVMGRLMKKTPKDVEILLAGSAARGTQIKGNSDVDIFLLFPRELKESIIEKKGLEIAKKIVNRKGGESYIVKYAEHPYTRLILKDLNINVDIVPAYKIETAKERGTAVDRTQLHNEFVNSKLTGKQRDDVRILKVFLRSHNIYGAEARIEGFSGYLCELLIYNFGSFEELIVGIANINLPLIIDVAKHHGTDTKEIRKKFFGKSFIVIDPTDRNRNVAANVSDESLLRFALASRALLKSPDKDTFYGTRRSDIYSERKLAGIRKILNTNMYVLHFAVPEIAEDIIWQQLRKARTRIDDLLRESGFSPMISLQNVKGKDAVIAFFACNSHIAVRKVVGPGIRMGGAMEKFIKAHKDRLLMYVDKDRICVIEKAEYSNPENLIRGWLGKKSTRLPSNLNARKCTLYVNKVPEMHAKLVYDAYLDMFTL